MKCCGNIACALRWGVAFVGVYSTGHDSPFMGKHFRCREYTGNYEESRIVALQKYFCKLYVQTSFPTYFIMQESCN